MLGPLAAAAQDKPAIDPLTESISEMRRDAAQRAIAAERAAIEAERMPVSPAFPEMPARPGFPGGPWESDAPPTLRDRARDNPGANLLQLLLRPVTVEGAPKDERVFEAPAADAPRVLSPRAPAAPARPGIATAPIRPITPTEIEDRKRRLGGDGRSETIVIEEHEAVDAQGASSSSAESVDGPAGAR